MRSFGRLAALGFPEQPLEEWTQVARPLFGRGHLALFLPSPCADDTMAVFYLLRRRLQTS